MKPLFLLLVVAFCGGCMKSTTQNVESASTESTPSGLPIPSATITSFPQRESPIRKIDFANRTYLGPGDYAETFTLKNGEKPFVRGKEDGIDLTNVSYADITGDGQEDAIVQMGVLTGGSANPSLVFVYTLKNGAPKVLWSFIGGDRAEGGIKDIYEQDGKLVVELFGVAKLINNTWEATVPKEKERGLCCPTIYTRTVLSWNGKKFVPVGSPEVFDIPESSQ
jgi:hypothetical protein